VTEESLVPMAAACAGLAGPTATASGLPAQAYTDGGFLSLETDRLFRRGWVYVGAAGAVPEPGDVLPVTVADAPILLIRGRDGSLGAFHNICRHRGTVLLREPQRGRPTITCPYHAWTYRLDGTLHRTPNIMGEGIHDCPAIDRAAYGLVPVRFAQWSDLIFVNLSGDALPFDEFIAPLAARWRGYDVSRFRYAGTIRYELKCNWKLAIENYLESYHLPWVHPDLNSYSRVSDHYFFNSAGTAFGQGTRVYAPAFGEEALAELEGLSESDRRKAEYPVLFPNLMMGLQADHLFVIAANPLAPGVTEERFDYFIVSGGEHRRAAIETSMQRWDKVFREDIDVVERMQEGRASPAMDGGRFVPERDDGLHLFQRRVAEELGFLSGTAGLDRAGG
jgi:choline monooxygenase